MWLHYMWASPLFVVAVIVIAYLQLGPAALIGFGLLFLLIPMQIYFGKRVGRRKRTMMPKTDRRTELFSQVLNGIEVVKLYR
jgi:ABC-type bacteriocin/lantibiotic exporter with double-glycine peptidase domain